MSQENVEIVDRFLRRWAQQDTNAALEDIDPEAVLDWSNSDAPDSGIYNGHAAWRAFFQRRDEVFGDRRVDSAEVIPAAPDTVVLCARVREQARASALDVEAGAAAVLMLHEGKIVSLKIYQTRHEALQAVGLEE